MSKKRHGHHGGAWKVAYADFVTAMMALFMVLWLISEDQKLKEAIQDTFRAPLFSATKDSSGLLPNKDSQMVKPSQGNIGSASVVELDVLRKLAADLVKMLQSNPESPDDNPVKLEMTPEGLRISVFDRTQRPVFESGSAAFTPYGGWVFSTLAWEVTRFTNSFNIELEGHTEQGLAPKSEQYTQWELSTDRANSARRKLLEHQVAPAQIRKVAGFADTLPLPDISPKDESNRRVSVLLKLKSGNRP